MGESAHVKSRIYINILESLVEHLNIEPNISKCTRLIFVMTQMLSKYFK